MNKTLPPLVAAGCMEPPIVRRPYQAPRLVRHGTVRELTAATSTPGPGDDNFGPSGT